MEKEWLHPQIEVQNFEANEYVAACYDTTNGTLTIQCNVGVWDGKKGAWIDSEGNWHGDPCRTNTVASYSGNSGTEYNSDGSWKSDVTNLVINDGTDDGVLENGIWPATWHSVDAKGIHYTHSGIATVTNVVEDGNHS